MCGRYQFNFKSKDYFQERFDIKGNYPYREIKTRYNVAPGQIMPVIVSHSPNAVEMMLWGLIPAWEKSDKPKGLINLRDDTVGNKKWAWKYLQFQRCLIPASGFYEWKKTADDKIPYYIHLKNENLFSFAGLYSEWQNKKSYAIITTSPNSFMEKIHFRMPVILTPGEEKFWLNPDNTEVDQLKTLLKPYKGEMESQPISKRINSPLNDDENLLKPVKENEESLFG